MKKKHLDQFIEGLGIDLISRMSPRDLIAAGYERGRADEKAGIDNTEREPLEEFHRRMSKPHPILMDHATICALYCENSMECCQFKNAEQKLAKCARYHVLEERYGHKRLDEALPISANKQEESDETN